MPQYCAPDAHDWNHNAPNQPACANCTLRYSLWADGEISRLRYRVGVLENDLLLSRIREEQLASALEDFRDTGLRCDLNPTMDVFRSGLAMYGWWADYLRSADTHVRDRARRALATGAIEA